MPTTTGDEFGEIVALGQAENGTRLVVVHSFEGADATSATVQIISAREATKRERQDYEDGQSAR